MTIVTEIKNSINKRLSGLNVNKLKEVLRGLSAKIDAGTSEHEARMIYAMGCDVLEQKTSLDELDNFLTSMEA